MNSRLHDAVVYYLLLNRQLRLISLCKGQMLHVQVEEAEEPFKS